MNGGACVGAGHFLFEYSVRPAGRHVYRVDPGILALVPSYVGHVLVFSLYIMNVATPGVSLREGIVGLAGMDSSHGHCVDRSCSDPLPSSHYQILYEHLE